MSDPQRLGKYEIRSTLGKGAMGVVYKAFDPHIEREVAIKTIRKDMVDADLAGQFMSRFKNEAKAAGRLHHPNIVGIYEYGEDETVAYIAMEYIDGTGLREYLNRKARFELGQIVSIVTQLLQALDFAHSRGVVHRDIKPANLILTADGALKVADFGIARVDTANLTQTGMVMGTPSYMSPEQCRGRDSDHRSDLFSAAVVLYELLTGERPFGGSVEMIAYKICHEEPRPPTQVASLPLPPSLDDVVQTALAKSPDSRFQNARAFQHALQVAAGVSAASSGIEPTVLNLAYVELQAPTQLNWDETTLSTVERQLAHFVGPMARVLVRKAATQTHDVAELYSLLATNIGDDEARERFVAAANGGDGTGSRILRTGSATGAGTGTQGVPVNPLEPEFVHETTLRLAVYLGPIAKVVARKAAEKARSQDEFVQLVAEHIGAQERQTFLKELGFRAG